MAAKLLLIDDDGNRRDSVREMLKSNSSFVVEGADCVTGISLLATETFDLILLDITLPDRSGFLVLQFLEKNHIASKVMVITGTVGVANVIRTATPGAREYITKPFNPDDLLKSIEHILSDRVQSNLKLHIIKAGEFIESSPTGDLDLKGSKDGLAQIAALGSDLQEYTVLIDLRDIKSQLTTSQIHELGTDLSQYGDTFRRKTAMLVRPDKDINQARFFEDVAQNRGFSVRVFTVFEEAIRWLSEITSIAEDHLNGSLASDR